MKRIVITLLSLGVALCAPAADIILHRTAGSITFTVDENLPAPKQFFKKFSGADVAQTILMHQKVDRQLIHIVASSFAADSIGYLGHDPLFSCMRYCFADHRPLVLSPDVVWLAIGQGFARYVNAHPEELRSRLVDHEGKQELTVVTADDLLAEGADWAKVVEGFAAKLGQHTKDSVAELMTADFTTTGTVERIASQVTMMDAFKPFFDYKAVYIVCGIPSITLQGTPADWRRVLAKTRRLADYGLQPWVAQLEPILNEFVKAAEGQPNQRFWQDMVSRVHPNELRGGGCSSEKSTQLDGWFLAFFPNRDGQPMKEVDYDYRYMPDEMSTAAFKYQRVSPTGEKLDETTLELQAGVIGVDEDLLTRALTPRIGWLVRQTETTSEIIQRLDLANKYSADGIKMQVDEVPLALSQLPTINRLEIDFTGKVVVPEWLDVMEIKQLTLRGTMTEAEADALRKRFPQAVVERR